MKHRNIKVHVCSWVLALSFVLPAKSFAYVIPKYLPTIEALIALHKAIKKDEDKALQRVAMSFGEQSLITKGADKFNDVRTTLDTRLSNANSYLVLAGAISSTANSLYQLVRDYKNFTTHTFKYVSDKPFVAWYYADANVAIAREIKHCYKLYATGAASGINLYCYLVTDCGWKPDDIGEILNSTVKEEIANRIINQWNKGYAI